MLSSEYERRDVQLGKLLLERLPGESPRQRESKGRALTLYTCHRDLPSMRCHNLPDDIEP